MCSRVTCTACGKATWTGCGQHVEEALRGVPDEDRCACHDRADDRAEVRQDAGQELAR
ncbi:hypothetical protein [Microbacterium sp.]|uniref:hypothetical protein n=1 Tax=Microbacterium sp. TaxID=51671 RepID=UPI0039E6C7D8